MSDDALLEAVHVLNPRTLERARRLASALALLRSGMGCHEARLSIRARFRVDYRESWQLVAMASDMAEVKA